MALYHEDWREIPCGDWWYKSSKIICKEIDVQIRLAGLSDGGVEKH